MINFGTELKSELNNILKYWMKNTLDFSKGGFVGQINHANCIVPDAPKGVVLNTRILWTFSAAYNFEPKAEYLEIADRAYCYILEHFWDKENEGLFWKVDADGIPSNTRKQTYAQGFGVYGFSEYYKAKGEPKALEYAQKLFRLIEEKSLDCNYGGYIEALTADWNSLEDMRLSKKDANEPKSMNTHLHILEPYTNLYRVWPDESLAQAIKNIIRIFLDKIIDPQNGHFNLFFGMDWMVKSSAISYGHDIEGAWLLREAAEEINDSELLEEVEEVAVRLVDITLAEGLDKDDSLFYEKEKDHLDTDKHWWAQAEAMVGLMDAWQINGKSEYLLKMKNIWTFIKSYLIDKENGEWYWSVDENGIKSNTEDKAGFWKCPYHNSRALIEILQRIEKIGNRNLEEVLINGNGNFLNDIYPKTEYEKRITN